MPTGFESSDNQFPSRHSGSDREPLSEDLTEETLWDLLSAYVDGEATPEEAAQVEAMLRTDPAYARDLEFLRLSGESARSYVEIEPPATLRDAIFGATSHRPTFGRRLAAAWSDLRRTLAPGALRYGLPAAGAVAAAALLTVAFWPRHGTTTPNLVKHPSPRATESIASSSGTSTRMQKPPRHHIVPSGSKDQEPKEMVATRGNTESGITHRNHPKLEQEPGMRIARNTERERNPLSLPIRLTKTELTKKWKFPNPGVHHPTTNDPNDPVVQQVATVRETGFQAVPGMDQRNQRLAWMNASGSIKDLTLTDNNVTASEPSSGSGNNTPSATSNPAGNGAASNAPQVASGMKASGLTGRMGRLMREQLPPDPHLIVSNADLKRRHDAATLGYSHDALQGIQRGQATVSLISGKF